MTVSADGWNYATVPAEGGDARKIVTLMEGSMVWVGIRAWNHNGRYWMNGNDREIVDVVAWRDLDEPAKGRWVRGKLVL